MKWPTMPYLLVRPVVLGSELMFRNMLLMVPSSPGIARRIATAPTGTITAARRRWLRLHEGTYMSIAAARATNAERDSDIGTAMLMTATFSHWRFLRSVAQNA